jgi:hypothetical protein
METKDEMKTGTKRKKLYNSGGKYRAEKEHRAVR